MSSSTSELFLSFISFVSSLPCTNSLFYFCVVVVWLAYFVCQGTTANLLLMIFLLHKTLIFCGFFISHPG